MDPDRYDKDSFRTTDLEGVKGAKKVTACPKGKFENGRCSVGTEIQTLIFDKDAGWTKEKVLEWWKEHKKDFMAQDGSDTLSPKTLIEWIASNPMPSPEDQKAFEDANELTHEQLMAETFMFMSALIGQGDAAKAGLKEADVDQEQLSEGITVEYEHVDEQNKYGPFIAKMITMDHLSEVIDYYTKLLEYVEPKEDNTEKEDVVIVMDAKASGDTSIFERTWSASLIITKDTGKPTKTFKEIWANHGEKYPFECQIVDDSVCSWNWALEAGELDNIVNQIPNLRIRLDHNQDTVRDMVGRFNKAWREGNRVIGAGLISDKQIAKNLHDGLITDVSMFGKSKDVKCSVCGESSLHNAHNDCPNSHDVIKGVMLEEVSFVTKGAFGTSKVLSFGASLNMWASERRPEIKGSDEGPNGDTVGESMTEKSEDKVIEATDSPSKDDRLEKLETAMAKMAEDVGKLMKSMSAEDEKDEDDKEAKAEDEEKEDEEKVEDDKDEDKEAKASTEPEKEDGSEKELEAQKNKGAARMGEPNGVPDTKALSASAGQSIRDYARTLGYI